MKWKIALLSGVFGWTFIEYALHRFILHGPLAKWHDSHHIDPEKEEIDWKPWLAAGVLGGYLTYHSAHWAMHHQKLGGRLQEYHEVHHDKPNKNFGVITLLWDRVLGTFEEQNKNQSKLLKVAK